MKIGIVSVNLKKTPTLSSLPILLKAPPPPPNSLIVF